MTEREKLNTLISYLEKEVPGFRIKYKEESWFQGKLIPKLAFFVDYLDYITTIYPTVWYPDREDVEKYPRYSREILEHEATHLFDMQTFFGLLPFMPRYFNAILFSILYLQAPLALFSLLTLTGNLWWLLFLLFILPLPAPFRAWAEVRGYRRSIELGQNLESAAAQFTGPPYYYMWIFGSHIRGWLKGPSPYKNLFDSLYGD